MHDPVWNKWRVNREHEECLASIDSFAQQKKFALLVNWDIIWTGNKIKMHCLALLILFCMFSTVDGSFRSQTVWMGFGAVCSNFAAWSIIDALGFTADGLAAGSWAERLQTLVTYINGGTLPPENFINTLQSIGIKGFSLSTKLLLGTVGALIFLLISTNL
ncbi:uncharacterized protein [Hemitrygon akajei]|uniref:uncharacterized protein isoform X2 n=1 Tax=Hemitrygon akajei TaxID=2704970 RepID=UPI003BF97940